MVTTSQTGALCNEGGAHLTVRLRHFNDNEKVRVTFRFIPSGNRDSRVREVTTDADGKATVPEMDWHFEPGDCPTGDFYSVDVEVLRNSAFKSQRSWILYQVNIPLR